MAALSNVSMAPHACEGSIGGIATVNVDSAMSNFLVQEIWGLAHLSGIEFGFVLRAKQESAAPPFAV